MPMTVNTADSACVTLGNSDDSSNSTVIPPTDSRKEKITVVVRLRPINAKQSKRSVIALDNKSLLLEEKGNFTDKQYFIDPKIKTPYNNNQFIFDAVFPEDVSQEEVYNVTTKYLIHEVIAGYNGMIFAYGATGSGKTYTMMAMNYLENGQINFSKCGIIIQAFRDVFSIIEQQQERFIVSLSYMEIYNETIKDLFNTDSGYLELRGNNNVQIIGLTELVVTSSQQAISLLKKGNEIRSVRCTGANCVSSRSHAVLIMVLRQTREEQEYNNGFQNGTRQSKLLFVDLAGSERAKYTKNGGKRLQEGGHINKSLLALGNCISALSNGTKAPHVNFRDSKLTRLLREPLSGNYRTIMIAQVNPSLEFKEDVKNTLTFATKAMGITKRIRRNVVSTNNHVPRYQNLITELRDEVTRLKDKIREQHGETNVPTENYKAKKLRDEMISIFEERVKLSRQLLDVDNHILLLNTEAEKQHQLISQWQSKSNKLYRWRNSALPDSYDKNGHGNGSVQENINKTNSALNSIEMEQDRLVKFRNEMAEKLENLKNKAEELENELHISLDEDTEKELLKLFCRVHELEADKLSLQGERMIDAYELRRSSELISRYQEQQKISDNIITKQRQLIEEKKISMPTDLQTLYQLYQQEIHVTTMQKFNNFNNSEQIDHINLPFVKGIQKEIISNGDLRKKIPDTSSESNDEWDTNDSEDRSPTRLPQVHSLTVNENNRSSNPSPIPAAVLFPPITF